MWGFVGSGLKRSSRLTGTRWNRSLGFVQAFKSHQLHDVLASPGSADLTADVDFSYLRRMAGGGVTCLGPVTQRTFLKNMGIDTRLQVSSTTKISFIFQMIVTTAALTSRVVLCRFCWGTALTRAPGSSWSAATTCWPTPQRWASASTSSACCTTAASPNPRRQRGWSWRRRRARRSCPWPDLLNSASPERDTF